jgi:hypothetical protein
MLENWNAKELECQEFQITGLDILQDFLTRANSVSLPHRENDRLGADHFARLIGRVLTIVWRP